MDIMSMLFDQDEVTRSLLEAKQEEARNEGRNEGRNEVYLNVIKNGRDAGLSIELLMKLTGLSQDEIRQMQS